MTEMKVKQWQMKEIRNSFQGHLDLSHHKFSYRPSLPNVTNYKILSQLMSRKPPVHLLLCRLDSLASGFLGLRIIANSSYNFHSPQNLDNWGPTSGNIGYIMTFG